MYQVYGSIELPADKSALYMLCPWPSLSRPDCAHALKAGPDVISPWILQDCERNQIQVSNDQQPSARYVMVMAHLIAIRWLCVRHALLLCISSIDVQRSLNESNERYICTAIRIAFS